MCHLPVLFAQPGPNPILRPYLTRVLRPTPMIRVDLLSKARWLFVNYHEAIARSGLLWAVPTERTLYFIVRPWHLY